MITRYHHIIHHIGIILEDEHAVAGRCFALDSFLTDIGIHERAVGIHILQHIVAIQVGHSADVGTRDTHGNADERFTIGIQHLTLDSTLGPGCVGAVVALGDLDEATVNFAGQRQPFNECLDRIGSGGVSHIDCHFIILDSLIGIINLVIT